MPIKDKDFGKYKRPDIFIEEIDNSVIELPIQDVLVNLVPGFSKKGPVNAPIYVTNPVDFSSVFGDDDRRLENKGSFFHKTVKQMLKNGPVWALNLLSTNPNRDKVDWQSISVSAQYENGAVTRSAYESFFNRQDFWERDTDAFLNVVKANNYGIQDNDRLFHITNMADKDITVFMYKSRITGFDVTAEEWYGDRTKVPPYIDYRELISDYLVSVVVVAGDWSDYVTLSNDGTFYKYFNTNGLIKSQVDNFLAERTVTILAKYDCSLIPYFKDLNNRDMYIKNVINANTDKSGLFCTYNENSLLEADFKLGNLDIVGDVLVGEDVPSIKFMSYDTTLKNVETYTQKYLDSSNNVFTNNFTSYNTNLPINLPIDLPTTTRSGCYTNGHTNNYYITNPHYSGFTLNADSKSYYVINGTVYLGITGTTYYDKITPISTGSTEQSRYDVLYFDNNNNINILYGTSSNVYSGTGMAIKPEYLYSLDETIIIGYMLHQYSGGSISTNYTGVTINAGLSDAYIPVNTTITTGTDYLRITFSGLTSSSVDYKNYESLRMLHAYNEISEKVSDQSVLIALSGVSTTFEAGTKIPVTSIEFPPDTWAIIDLYVDSPSLCTTGDTFLLYYVDNEFLLKVSDTIQLITSNQDLNNLDSVAGKERGIVAKYSAMYQDYYNGNVNNTDYFYANNSTGDTKYYLQMYLDENENLIVEFLDGGGETKTINNWGDGYKYHFDIHSDKANWKQSIEIVAGTLDGVDKTTCQEIVVDRDRYSEITRGSYLAAYYDETNWQPGGAGYLEGSVPRKLTRVTKVKNDPNDDRYKTLYTDAPIKLVGITATGYTTEDYQTYTYPSIDSYVDEYKALVISPFVIHTDSIPDGTDTRQNAILNVISKDTNLAKGLADKNKISWRYLVDSFGLGIEPVDGFGSKQQLADLCGMKLNSIGFINMPSAKIFKESTNPSFVDADGNLDLSYVKQGANEDLNPNYYYQFAMQHGEIDGRSCVGYFFPYVRIYDNGIPKFVPPSAYAATTYMQKFVSNVAGMLPWTIAAGITNGRIQGITKTEMDFTNTDLENLHAMGANPIVYRVNNGYCINDESTAQIFPYSSLSFLHSREVLIELENRLYDMLLRYQWKFNTQEMRAEIKYKADKICKDMLDSDAFYDFWNVCDETNNTDYVIDMQMGVLDTYVEIIKGMGIIVNNITILKKGDIQSMGFK